jgi:spore coat polysaccharide biosynthesis protein SpsF (cytidylyltransferase family)
MVQKVLHYQTALGKKVKHPTASESAFRGVLFKKVLDNDVNKELKRADYGNDYLTEVFNSFDKQTVGVGIIARLKSKRLKKKVLKPFLNGTLINDLYHRIASAKGVKKTSIITSFLPEDGPLVNFCDQNGLDVFKGHPVSVIDRMLSFALENKFGTICRVTGDNPLSDPTILEKMIELMEKEDLDYIKVNNVPIGVGVELYSVSYLWKLYLKMDNPLTSEYLAWIALNDKGSKKGCIDVVHPNPNLSYYNLSVDFQEDYDRCMKVLKEIDKTNFTEVTLKDVLDTMDLINPSDRDMVIKLPGGEATTFEKFNALIDNSNYAVRAKLEV